MLALASPSWAAVYVVTNTNSSGAGSLADAVQKANYTTPNQLDYINFNIAGSPPFIITITTDLFLNDQVVINGQSQPGYAGDPLIHIHGNGSVNSIFILQTGAPNASNNTSTIQGVEMYNFNANGVTIFNSSQGNFIQNNWIGFHKNGGTVLLNRNLGGSAQFSRGFGIQSSWNTIRGNTISGVDNGITIGDDFTNPANITGTTYVTNSFSNNKIGTDPTGTTATGYGNSSDGIFLGAGAQEMWIGPSNVLSGMSSSGVELLHSTNYHNIIFANYIGTDVTGMVAIPNGELGVLLSNGAHENAVGGPWGGNVISGNGIGGVSLGTNGCGVCSSNSANYNWVQYNVIGMNANQTNKIPQPWGVTVAFGSTYNTVEGNAIGGHTQNGIVVTTATNNSVSRNYVGRTFSGTPAFAANANFGIALLSGANYNWVLEENFGTNSFGNFYIDPGAIGNVF